MEQIMFINSSIYTLLLLFILNLCSCKEKEKTKQNGDLGDKKTGSQTSNFENTASNERSSYDSIVYYKDANWASFKGVNRVDSNYANYPFLVYSYQGNKLYINVRFSAVKSTTWVLVKLINDRFYTTNTQDYSPDYRKGVFTYRIFDSDTSSIAFTSLNIELKKDSVEITSVSHLTSNDQKKLNEKIFIANYGERDVEVKALLSFDTKKLMKNFDSYLETKTEIMDGKSFETYQLYKEIAENKTTIRNQKFEQIPDFKWRSYFYMYTELFQSKL